jgi:hypothetical protein
METFNYLLDLLMTTFSTVFDFIRLPILDFLDVYPSDFASFLQDALEFTGLTAFLSDVSFGGFFFGGTLLTMLVITIVYFFIP